MPTHYSVSFDKSRLDMDALMAPNILPIFGIGGAGGYSSTPEGKIIIAAFADSYNQLVTAVRSYKAQTVRGGLGTGGTLGVQGGSTPASRAVDAVTQPVKKK